MAARRSPTIQRRRLGIELRRLRDQAGRNIEEAATALECSDSKISRIETGQVRVTLRDVRELLDLYGVQGERRDAVLDVARKAREKGWWQEYGDTPGVPMIGLQAAASVIETYEAQVVPGLLQTADYARTVIRGANPDFTEEQVRRWVELRMARQARLADDDAPQFVAVLDEAVLRRQVGGAQVMGDQLLHLLRVAGFATVTLQILPFDAGEHAGLSSSFTIFRLPEPSDPDVVFLEHVTRDLYLESEEELLRYAATFDRLRGKALDPVQSLGFIETLVKGSPTTR